LPRFWLNVCAEVLESSVESDLEGKNLGILWQLDCTSPRKQLPLLSNSRIFQSEPLNPAT
jgi:hypothetical protein